MENGNLKRQAPASSAKYLLGAIALTFVLQMATVYVPILNPIFKTEPLILSGLLAVLALSTIIFIAVEIEKFFKRKRAAREIRNKQAVPLP
ncbi:MAG: hypothetical protein A2Z46_03000 [Nitrospirae bacterium RBG_19FT_COMBO_55_12]|nr:MAG: hypothetical protein A2Z46_03000 [Nitrospirae bacterium RBG_19FT_COMBO_55_12]